MTSRSRRGARLDTMLAAWGLALSVFTSTAGAQGLEYEVKAAFLFNFIKFTEWPRDAFETADAPFRLCVAEPDPFGASLDRTVGGESLATHPITVERVTELANVGPCHLVFVPLAAATITTEHLRAAGRALTVGESSDFLRRGGIVLFVIDGGRVRFDVDVEAALSRGLRVSSRLLRLARRTGKQE